MNHVFAGGIDYFEGSSIPIAIRRVRTDASKSESHPHDLTEIEHTHDFCELVIITSGNAMHTLEGDHFPVTAGDVFLLQGNQSHHFYNRNSLELINIMYDPNKIGLPENDLRKLPGYSALFLLEPTYRRQHRFASHLHLKRVPLARAERLAEEMENECALQNPGYEIILSAKLLEMIVFLSRAYTSSESTEAHALLRVCNVIGAIESNFAYDWKIEELLKIAHMSRSNLMRVFRKATGQTPIDYLVRLRLQKAMELLRNSDLPITEIGLEVGFNDSNYFSRQFRRILNESPSHFRSRHKTY